MSDKFWAVWRKTGGSAPSKKHETLDEVKKEASRLAGQSGESYYVLECIGLVAPLQAPIEYSEIV